jgi:CGNR zinc finger/Putative stress-induced transcription regulator
VSWPATGRYGIKTAPGGLALVQDLLNTAPAGKPREPDLLGHRGIAQEWLGEALPEWTKATHRAAPGHAALTEHDIARLRTFRNALHELVASGNSGGEPGTPASRPPLPSPTVTLKLDGTGQVYAEPHGEGWKALVSLVLIEIFEAQRSGVWQRLKTCRNPRCAVAFFDRSRNNIGVWHDVHICGNALNLRAYRARRRAGAG